MATLKQFKADIRKAKAVYGSVVLMSSRFADSTYIQLVKADVLFQVAGWDADTEMNYRVESDGIVYIN
jgi:hypothetical protein